VVGNPALGTTGNAASRLTQQQEAHGCLSQIAIVPPTIVLHDIRN
jgi:hypothetical protein